LNRSRNFRLTSAYGAASPATERARRIISGAERDTLTYSLDLDSLLHPLPNRERKQKELTVADLGVVDYDDALAVQTAMLAARIDDGVGDTILMMEHPHVFTLGRGADEGFIVGNTEGVPVRRVSRGGQVTYHGPGQLIGYPILKLEGRYRDVTRYLRHLEAAMIDALAKFGIDARRRDG